MNIWCISKYASPPKYGVAARIFYLAKHFSKLGNQTAIITSDSNHLARYPETNAAYNYENVDGVQVIWTKNIKYKKTASVARILSWFHFEMSLFRLNHRKLFVPDVIIVSSLSLLSIIYGYYLKRKYSAFLIFEIRDIWPLTLIEEGGFSRFNPLCLFLSLVEKFGYKKADLIVGTMPRLNRHVFKVLGYEKSFFCSPLGFEPKEMKKRELITSHKLSSYFPKNKLIIGYAGSMGISNNLDTFIECIKKLDSNKEIHFVLVGAGDCRKVYEKMLYNKSNVTFVPKIKAEEVPCFLSHCDVLYLSTHDSTVWEYGQSMNKVVEYMYAAKPVIASYSGFPSMLDEAGSGVFVEPNNVIKLEKAILEFATLDEDKRIDIGANGKKWIIANRTYPSLAKSYLAVITKMTTTKVAK